MSTVLAPTTAPVPAPPHDPLFEEWAAEGLVWLPERGMGRLHVREAPYDEDYFAKYQGYAETEMGRAITAARVDLVLRHAGANAGIVDVGIGCGDFLAAWAGRAQGYDVNPAGVDWLRERGLFRDPRKAGADVLTFWDALEHLPDPRPFLDAARRWVFVSIPIVPGDGPPSLGWKHLRRDEHCWYFTRRGLIGWMGQQGFRCLECTATETLVGREDVETFAFHREG